jgi:hypothetical protein
MYSSAPPGGQCSVRPTSELRASDRQVDRLTAADARRTSLGHREIPYNTPFVSPRPFARPRPMSALRAFVVSRLMFRVVRCLPTRVDVRDRDDTARAGVAQAPREETAACSGAIPEAKWLWGFDGWLEGRWRERADGTEDDVAQIANAWGAIVRSWMTRRAGSDVEAA